jgi:hypothetical protein
VVTAKRAAIYLTEYVKLYRREYERFIATPPDGAGYPPLRISPYLHSSELYCYLAKDGAVLADFTLEPPYDWAIHGPTFIVDTEETKNPPEIRMLLGGGVLGAQGGGVYRIVAHGGVPDEIWSGVLPKPSETASAQVDQTVIHVQRFTLSSTALLDRLTFGAFARIVNLRFPSYTSEFWAPRIIRDLGISTADLKHKQFFHYCELLGHVDDAAWEPRSAWARANMDVRRDFAFSVAYADRGGGVGTLSFDTPLAELGPPFRDRLAGLRDAIEEFESLLEEQPEADERVFHSYLEEHPILLDVYGSASSKPRFTYPAGASFLGKSYVEPDFIIQYPENTYKLIELEKPGHELATKRGDPRTALTHAAFQIAEWKDYIARFYTEIQNDFPGIAGSYKTMVIISRTSQRYLDSTANIHEYLSLVRQQLAVNDILTYDDLITHAKTAFVQIAGLAQGTDGS